MVSNFNKKIFFALFIYLVIDVLLKLVYKFHVLNDEILLQYYYNQFSEISAEQRLKNSYQNIGIKLLLTETFNIIKMMLISGVVTLGIFLFNYTNKAKFKKILFVVIKSYYIFLVPGIIQVFWFAFLKENYSVEDLTSFNWHTILFWINDLKYDFLKYPLSVINLYEILFWIILVFLLKNQIEETFWESFKLVLLTYGLGLLTWIVFIVFIIVIIS